MILLDLIQNIALLVALVAAFQVIQARWHMRRLTSQLLSLYMLTLIKVDSFKICINL